jgi:hypothetical protein
MHGGYGASRTVTRSRDQEFTSVKVFEIELLEIEGGL